MRLPLSRFRRLYKVLINWPSARTLETIVVKSAKIVAGNIAETTDEAISIEDLLFFLLVSLSTRRYISPHDALSRSLSPNSMTNYWLTSKPAPDPPILDWLRWLGKELEQHIADSSAIAAVMGINKMGDVQVLYQMLLHWALL